MEVTFTDDPAPLRRLSGIYLGEAYTGKTHNVCTWPQPLVVSFDPHNDTARKFAGVTIVEIRSWREFEMEVLPRVKNRQLSQWVGRPISTLAIDSMSVGAQRCAAEIQGPREQMRKPDWGILLSKLTTAVIDCTDATALDPHRESYHVLFTGHLKDVLEGEGDKQRVVAIQPAIGGAFAKLFPRLTSFTFICDTAIETEYPPNQTPIKRTTYFVHTARPDPKYTCGDRVGGGKYKQLPPKVGGTYPDLMAAWGIPENEQGIAIQPA